MWGPGPLLGCQNSHFWVSKQHFLVSKQHFWVSKHHFLVSKQHFFDVKTLHFGVQNSHFWGSKTPLFGQKTPLLGPLLGPLFDQFLTKTNLFKGTFEIGVSEKWSFPLPKVVPSSPHGRWSPSPHTPCPLARVAVLAREQCIIDHFGCKRGHLV